MNARQIALALTLTLSSFAACASSTEEGTLRWECARTGAPRYHEIATAFGYDNYQYMREAQPRLYRDLRRACAGGADAVLIVMDVAKVPQVRAELAAR